MIHRRTAFLYMSHRRSDLTEGRYHEVKSTCDDRGKFWLLYDNRKDDLPLELDAEIHPFRFSEIRAFGFRLPAYLRGMQPGIWGHCDTAVLHFFRQNRQFDFYWLIEYDVGYSGLWSEFFDYWASSDADFICQYLMRPSEAPTWKWWSAIGQDGITKELPNSAKLRCFCPIFRISHRAIELLNLARANGWWGNCEILMPTLFNLNRLQLEDMGGSGEFVRPENRERFYLTSQSMYSQRQKPVEGSVRWRPFLRGVGEVPDKLWHPVKLDSCFSYFEDV